ncbi:hypothetical protein HYE00_02285 [Mycoplasmopsis bovis]|nr:hypothetical protein [Mycoplasmopsis bovis]QQH28713.1 hypothetical protein HYE00_02285 [Mycoplasmopsis bovis]
MIKILKIISTDDEIKSLKGHDLNSVSLIHKYSFPFKVSNIKLVMSLLKIKKSTYL